MTGDENELAALRELVRKLQDQIQELQDQIQDAKKWQESVITNRQMYIQAQDHLEVAD